MSVHSPLEDMLDQSWSTECVVTSTWPANSASVASVARHPGSKPTLRTLAPAPAVQRHKATKISRSEHKEPAKPAPLRGPDRLLPFANVSRLMAMELPKDAKVAREAKILMQEMVSEFICFMCSEANDISLSDMRKSISQQDILASFGQLDLDAFMPAMEASMEHFSDHHGLRPPERPVLPQTSAPPTETSLSSLDSTIVSSDCEIDVPSEEHRMSEVLLQKAAPTVTPGSATLETRALDLLPLVEQTVAAQQKGRVDNNTVGSPTSVMALPACLAMQGAVWWLDDQAKLTNANSTSSPPSNLSYHDQTVALQYMQQAHGYKRRRNTHWHMPGMMTSGAQGTPRWM